MAEIPEDKWAWCFEPWPDPPSPYEVETMIVPVLTCPDEQARTALKGDRR